MSIIRIGMDTSKRLFQLHGVDAQEGATLRRKMSRKEMVAFFRALPATEIGIEACGASHHWARTLHALGHTVKIMPAQLVKPYVKRNKNDAADAEGLCEAMSRPTMRFVPVKCAASQARLMLLKVREGLVRQRTRIANAIRGHAAEFGLVAPCGLAHLRTLLEHIAVPGAAPALAQALFAELGEDLAAVDSRVRGLDARLRDALREERGARRLVAIPGVGPVGALLLALKTPDPNGFSSGRDFAAWLGLTPRDHSTAGRHRLGGITRAGDEMLRSVLIAGATARLQQLRRGRGAPDRWLETLLERKTPKQAAVALANKTARIAWKLLVSGEDYRPPDSRPLGPRAPAPAP